MPKTRYVTEAQLIVIGRRYGADEGALEATEAAARWRRDLSALAMYGYGQAALDGFAADVAEHAKLRAARPEAVAEKKMSVATRDRQVSLGWAWVDKVCSMRFQPRCSISLCLIPGSGQEPNYASAWTWEHPTGVGIINLRLAADVQADKRLAEVDGLSQALQASPGAVHTSKGQTVADTAQIDLFDGKLYVCMRDLNSAGRKAIRNGDLRVGLHEYAFHHLKNSGNPGPAPVPVPVPRERCG